MGEPESANAQEQPKSSAPKRSRGAGFPVLSLPDAARAVKDLAKYHREHSLETVAKELGHDTTNSGPFRGKLAALKDWGLVSGTGDTVTITELGLELAHSTDDEDEQASLRKAFFKADLFSKMYSHSAKEKALTLENLGNIAVRNHGVGVRSKDKFSQSLADSAVSAGIAERVDQDSIKFKREPDEEGEGRREAAEGEERDEDGSPDRRRERKASREAAVVAPGVVRQVWPIRSGEIIFEINSHQALDADAFSQVAEIVTKASALAESLGPTVSDDEGTDAT